MCSRLIVLLAGLTLPTIVHAAERAPRPPSEWGRIERIRDRWGVVHVFSETDEGAMYGLGYATAEQRAFEMYFALRVIQGRAAEVLGRARVANRRETAVDNDRKMRTFGFYTSAVVVARHLDTETLAMLEAYCRGVNDFISSNRDKLHPLFRKLGLTPEPWTPADCIASWWHLGQFFATDGTRDLIHYRALTTTQPAGRMLPPKPGPLWIDDSAAVIQRTDVSDAWVERAERFAREHAVAPGEGSGDGPHFSHAWVVGGRKNTSGAAVLVSDPQTPVRNPSLWIEFHISGRSFNARGVGVPGSPMLLIGWTQHVAWGLTAAGADQADLFRLRTDPQHPDEYYFDGQWRPMTVQRESIAITGEPSEEIVIRRTHLGPVVTAFAFAGPEDGQVALKRVPMCETDRETIQAFLPMLRAANAGAFAKALAKWHFPTANCLFGDTQGNIGYRLLGALPVRSRYALQEGSAAQDGTSARFDWQGMVPDELMPSVMNPARGYLASANHRPIASFYRIPLGLSTGSPGDTVRSWRLRQLLESKTTFTPEEVLAIHYDRVNPARRQIVRIGYHLRDALNRELSAGTTRALEYLGPWYRAGAASDLSIRGAELAGQINTMFRIMQTPLARTYGGGQSGLCRFLKTVEQRIEKDPAADLTPDEQDYIDGCLADAWASTVERWGEDTAGWPAAARRDVTQRRLGYFDSLDGFGSLDPAGDLSLPPLTCVDGDTINSQAAQSYTQYVPLHDVDRAMSILPIGHSELPDDPLRRSTYTLWAEGKLHPAPLSHEAVKAIATGQCILSAQPGDGRHP